MVTLKPIGYFHTGKKQPFEAARQATFDKGPMDGYIELLPGQNFEQALKGLETCSHCWVIYQFHKNENWNPIVQPPRGPKQGVFATRSPHRPNPLGMSALEIKELKGLRIYVQAHDLLDGTPVFDIKPYHREADSIPSASLGWLEQLPAENYQVDFSQLCEQQLVYLESMGIREMRNFLLQQLEHEPLNFAKKRVFLWHKKAVIAYRTWRALFSVNENALRVEVLFSGYSEQELIHEEDRHQDKKLHREFNERFESRGDLPRFG